MTGREGPVARDFKLNPTSKLRSSPVQAAAAKFDHTPGSCVNYGMASKERPMKRIATAALAVCLLSGSSALAQPGQNRNTNNSANSGQPHSGAPTGNTQHTKGPPAGVGGPKGPPTGFTPQTTQHTVGGPKGPPTGFTPQTTQTNQNNNSRNWNQNNNNNNNRNQNNNNNSNNNNNRNNNNNNWSNNWRPNFGAPGYRPGGARPTYSRQFFPQVFNPTQRYNWRGSRWYGPPGYYYRSWYYGQILPFAWFTSQWWINDYYYYDLPVPPYGYAWVRNGPDALLVNISSGMIVSVVPGIFY
jgi:Ni/Co efflux regulator RcnB